MTAPLESSIVRFRKSNGAVVGAGFLVSEKHILTCAHVVADALGIARDTQKRPTEDVYLDFPLVAPEERLTARVVFWRPVPPKGSTSVKGKEDIVGLELKSPLPEAAQPVDLVIEEDLRGHSFRTFGFPSGHDDGLEATGVLCGRQGTGWVQLEDVKQTGVRLEPGFSGAPVWDEQLNGVVGLAVAADQKRPEAKVAFMIPTEVLATAWSALGELTIPPLMITQKRRFQFWRDRSWVWTGLLLLPFVGTMMFSTFQKHLVFHEGGVPMNCNAEPQLKALKIVVADFAKNDGSFSNDRNLENQLEAELTQQLGEEVVICRVEETISNRGKAREIGEQLQADVVVWGNRGESFTGGIESVTWEVEDQNLQLENPEAQRTYLYKDLPYLVALLTNLTLSQIYELQDDTGKAQKILLVAIQKAESQGLEKSYAKQLAKAYFILGLLYEQTDSLEQALHAYQKAFGKDKSQYIALLHQGIIFEELKQLDQAEKAYAQVIKLAEPTSAAVAHVNRASLRLEQSNYDEAEEDFKQAIILNESLGLRARASARLQTSNDIQGAVTDCQQLIYRLKSKNPNDYHLLGEAQLRAGDTEGAKKTYQEALRYLSEEQRNSIISKLNFIAQEKTELKDNIAAITIILK